MADLRFVGQAGVMVPILVLTGPVGVGKSAVLYEVDRLLVEAGVAHASVELEELARCWTPASETGVPNRAALVYGNLAAVWANYAAYGAPRLVIGMLLEDRATLTHLSQAIPGAQPTVVRLYAPLAVIEQRLRRREPDPAAELDAARYLVPRMDEQKVEDHLVDNGGRPLPEVAREIVRLVGWLPTTLAW
jgi:ribose 1,5-bisphosphokinase PhnN